MSPTPPRPALVSGADRFDLDRTTAIAQLLDRGTDDLTLGRQLPLAWHMCFFLPRPAQRDLGPDGHPLTGIPAPPGPGLRRMFAGGRITLLARPHADRRSTSGPRIGEEATAATEVGETRVREGRSGPLQFVSTLCTVSVGGVDVLVDKRDIVYLPARRGEPVAGGRAASDVPDAAKVRHIDIDPTLLFRFSALTYNAHRIHYDRDFARQSEGYPGLVVHGPLQALLMAELATEVADERTDEFAGPVTFAYKLTAPLYEHQGMQVLAGRDNRTADGVSRIWARVLDGTGRETAQATVLIDRTGR
jgi:3-methylfumaryl-CoA hydratase